MTDLSEQPPPRRGAKEGYYPDPLGTGRARWWDGSHWTYLVGPRLAPDAPKDRPAPPPKKICRHCSAESETFEGSCPNCGKAYGQGPGFIVAVIAAAVVGAIILIGGCAALIKTGIDEFEDELNESEITRAEFDSIELGTTRGAVEQELGEPFETETRTDARNRDVTCLEYPEQDQSLLELDTFELCFAGGILVEKRGP